MKHILSVAILASIVGALLFAQTPTVINRNGKWPPFVNGANSYGGPFELRWQAVPLSLTDITTKDAHLIGVTVFNGTGGALTLTLQTRDASPIPLPLNGSIPAGTSVSFNIPYGILTTNGFSIQGSGAGLNYQAVWSN